MPHDSVRGRLGGRVRLGATVRFPDGGVRAGPLRDEPHGVASVPGVEVASHGVVIGDVRIGAATGVHQLEAGPGDRVDERPELRRIGPVGVEFDEDDQFRVGLEQVAQTLEDGRFVTFDIDLDEVDIPGETLTSER